MVSELVSIRLEPLIAFVVEFSKVWERVCFMYFMIDSVHVASAAKKKKKENCKLVSEKNCYFAILAYGCAIGL
jgi:hypothetical protein